MAAYNGKSKRIKDALKELLVALQYDAGPGPEAAFHAVTGSTDDEGDGYPNAQVLPGDLDTEKSAVSTNERTNRFIIRMGVRLENSGVIMEANIDRMYDLTDLVLDLLDVGDYSGALNDIDPTLGTFMLNATRGEWGFKNTASGSALTCDVNVEVKYTKDLN